MKLYGVVNMDIVGSRLVRDRQHLQVKLNSYIDHINAKYLDILACPATVTLGDEWQLITPKPMESYNFVHEFQQLLWNDDMELYAGIGIGELSTPITDDIRKMDGSCFHIARNAINIAKNIDKLKSNYNVNKLNRVFLMTNRIPYDSFGFNILNYYYNSKAAYNEDVLQEIAVAGDNNTESGKNDFLDIILYERTLNLIIENNEVLKAKMTKKQRETYINYIKLGSYRKVVDLASGDNKESIGGISQKLNNASYFTIQRNHYMVSALLNAYCTGV